MKSKLCRVLLALSILLGAGGVAAIQEVSTAEPAAAQATYKKWEVWAGGMYHNWFVRVEQIPGSGRMLLSAWRFPYENPYNWNYAIREVHTDAQSFVCFRVLGGGHNVAPAKIQILGNGLNAGESCDATEVDGQWHPNLGYCFGDVAYTHAGQYYGWEQGYTCPYSYGTGSFDYGWWAPLDTSQDPRYSPGNHHWRLH